MSTSASRLPSHQRTSSARFPSCSRDRRSPRPSASPSRNPSRASFSKSTARNGAFRAIPCELFAPSSSSRCVNDLQLFLLYSLLHSCQNAVLLGSSVSMRADPCLPLPSSCHASFSHNPRRGLPHLEPRPAHCSPLQVQVGA